MATPTLSNNIVQIVRENEGNKGRVFDTQGLKRLIDDHCKDLGAHYPVYSIIGAQSSGKSTLMNYMFNTNFRELNQATEGWRATTKGIWAAICNVPKAVVLDIEGSDGEEHQDDAGFQLQSALFALMISDVMIFNIDLKDIGRYHGASVPILQIIFEECLKNKEMKKTKLVFTVRDYTYETPESYLVDQQLSRFEKIWKKQLTDDEVETLRQYFGKPSMEFFPHFKLEKEEFKKKCKSVIDKWSDELSYGGPNSRAIRHFPIVTEELWKEIEQNQKLGIPSYRVMVSHSYCQQIKSDITKDIKKSNELHSEGDQENPSDFHQRLKQSFDKACSTYNDKTKREDTGTATEVKKEMEEWIKHEAEKIIDDALWKFMVKLCVEAAEKITNGCQGTVLHKDKLVKSVVDEHIHKLSCETKDLFLYSKDRIKKYKEVFERDINFIGDKLLDAAVNQTCWDAAEVLSIGFGHAVLSGAVGVLVAATGGSVINLIPTVCPVLANMAARGIDNTLDASPAKLNSTKDKVLAGVLKNGVDSKGKNSGGSSSFPK